MQIQINNPCTEQWDHMAPNTDGRYCDKCCKTVVDFSTWEVAEIADYLKQNTGKRICGRLQISQATIANKTSTISRLWRNTYSLWNKAAAIILMPLGFVTTGCKEESQPIVKSAEPPKSTQTSSEEQSSKPIAGKKKHSTHQKDSILTMENSYILGDMAFDDLPDSAYRYQEPDSTL